MRFKIALFLLISIHFTVLGAFQDTGLGKKANPKRATEYYNYSYRLFNYIQSKGTLSDFRELIKISKKGISFTKASDFKNLSRLEFLIGMSHKVMLNNDSALYYLKNSIMNAQRGNEYDIEISAIQEINYLYRFLGQVEETNPYVKRLNVLRKEIKDIYLKDKIVSALSDDFLHRGSYTQAIELLIGSLATKEYLYKQKKDNQSRVNLGLAFSELGSLYLRLNQNQNALDFLKKGEPYFVNYTGGRVRLYKKMQQAYLNLSKIDSATIYYNKVYRTMKVGIYESAWDISDINRLFAEYYLARLNIPFAIKYAKTAYEKGMISESKEAVMMVINMMGNLTYQQKKYKEAISYFEKALPNSNNFSNDVFASINLKLAQSYEQMGNYQKANLFYNKYNLLRDTIYIEKTKEDINVIEFKYRTAQKEQRIDFLNAQSKTQEKELVRQKQYKTILLISVLLVLIIAGMILYNYKDKQKVNLLLDHKNKQLDILNSKLVISNQTKSKLFSIISHDLRAPVSQLFTFFKLQQINLDQISEDEKLARQNRLLQSASAILTTMEDLLLWSKSQMENFEIDLEEVDIHELFEESIVLIQDQATAKSVSIKVGDLKISTLQSDQNLLIIVLRNLLQNAINYAYKDTSIIINAGINDGKNPFISILNEGEMIAQEKIDELLSNQYVKSKLSGYGLVIVKELLYKLNGTLQITSTRAATIMTITFS
ncbi:MAG TPA: tetratricopeptide repeat-containing sensor histidine kinase [Pedobacter sp.]|nr:tetratricopeptide repeat-containing sensor histidine kinase [Pedobacter sp.]